MDGSVVMRIAVLSDIHSNMPALERVLSDLPNYDELYCLGDIVGYGPHPNEVVEALNERQPRVVLEGNHDHAVVTGNTDGFVDYAVKAVEWTRKQLTKKNLEYLSTLKPSAIRNVAGLDIALFHGSPRDPLNEYIFPGTPSAVLKELLMMSRGNILLLGHTHVPMAYRNGSSFLLNPGSVGQPRDGDSRAAYLILTIEAGNITHKMKRVQYEIEATSKAILESGLPSFLAERLRLGV